MPFFVNACETYYIIIINNNNNNKPKNFPNVIKL